MAEDKQEVFLSWYKEWFTNRMTKVDSLRKDAAKSYKNSVQKLMRESNTWQEFEAKQKQLEQALKKNDVSLDKKLGFAGMKAAHCLKTDSLEKCVGEFELRGREAFEDYEKSIKAIV